jgi:hypothetical protein
MSRQARRAPSDLTLSAILAFFTMRLSLCGSGRIGEVGIGPEKSLSESIREVAGGVMLNHHTLECLEIFPMEFLQIFRIEAFAVLTEMGSAPQFLD